MRAAIAQLLNRWLGTEAFTYLLPNYAILLCLSVVAGTLWAVRRARAAGLDPDPLFGLILWTFPAALLGGRLSHAIANPGAYHGIGELLDPLTGDSTAYGGFVGGSTVAIAYLRLRAGEVWRYLDCAAPGLGIAAAITRLGCFMDGCDFGSVSSSPLAIQFPPGSPAHLAHAAAGLISPGAAWSLPVHPVELYFSAMDLALAAAVTAWGRIPRIAAGEIFCSFWVFYAAGRFGLEFLRGDLDRGFIGPLSTAQAVSIPVFFIALIGLRRRMARRGSSAPATAPASKPEPARAAGERWTLLETSLATVLAAAVIRLLEDQGGLRAALAPATWIYVPLLFAFIRRAFRRTELNGPGPFGEAAKPSTWRAGWRWLLLGTASILVPFAVLAVAARAVSGHLSFRPLTLADGWSAILGLLLVAVPEELFFRGYLQSRLLAWSGERKLRGPWAAIVLGSLLFALAHLLVEPSWLRAAVFFPALGMGWLREKSGGLLAPIGFHWLANLLWAALVLG